MLLHYCREALQVYFVTATVRMSWIALMYKCVFADAVQRSRFILLGTASGSRPLPEFVQQTTREGRFMLFTMFHIACNLLLLKSSILL